MTKRIDNLGLFLQLVLFAAVIISLITSIFIGPLEVVTYGLMALILFVLCYNNYTMYKRKYLTIVYLIFGIMLTIVTFIGVFNAITSILN